MKEKMREGSDSKREIAMSQERKMLGLMEELKESGGPFTSSEQVDIFLTVTMANKDERKRKRRMKLEIQYARDTSNLLPKMDPIFRIRKTLANGKQRDNSSAELQSSETS